jgi:hypothetical protein
VKNKSTEQFITEAQLVHDFKYDYSLTQYTHSNVKVDVVCHLHGIFHISPNAHLRGEGCKLCGILRRGAKNNKTTQDFINVVVQ